MIKTKAFTLLELMIAVAIIGMLATIAVPAFNKYIVKSKMSEAYTNIRSLYDLEYIFPTLLHTRTVDNERVHCRLIPRYSSICMRTVVNGTGFAHRPPRAKKEYRAYFTFEAQSNSHYSYNSSTSTCTGDTAAEAYGHGVELNLASSVVKDHPNSGNAHIYEPGYYIYRARPDEAIAAEYGVDRTDTLSIWAVGDLDGDFVGTYGCGGSPYRFDTVSVISRSMYWKDGETIGTPGIYEYNIYE